MFDERLKNLGIHLPAGAAPAANYVPYVIDGHHLYISGQIPFDRNGSLVRGCLGRDCSLEAGIDAARLCGVNILAQIKSALGTLDRVERIVKLGVFVASAPDFTDQPKVANGASDLMVDVFGNHGRHARSAVGVSVLPLGVAVEVDAVISLRDGSRV